ncbi:MAG: hypothetical protein ABI614_16370, partial [Planctomycetota bacterium]
GGIRLGSSIRREITDAPGGEIHLISRPDHGVRLRSATPQYCPTHGGWNCYAGETDRVGEMFTENC